MRIYNTMSGRKEEFIPLGDPVKMYVCGVTPYDRSHVGHAMSYIAFDVIRRYLEYRGYRVFHVQNFTDIDDKLIARAQRLGVSVKELAERFIAEYFEDFDALNVIRAHRYVRATDEISAMTDIITGLMDRSYAYAAGSDVYFRVRRAEGYGKLSRRNLNDMQAGARIDVEAEKEHPMDFVLWKGAKPDEPSWSSPWGPGRPGWHIECSAIILGHLGEQIDIHGGGQDLIFPHHENEVAQSEHYTGCRPFVRYWLHNGLLQLGEEKMSKSLGNLVTIKEALEQYSADAIRLFVISSHYRNPLTYTDEGLAAAERGVRRLRLAVEGDAQPLPTPASLDQAIAAANRSFTAAMDDDFNTTGAQAALFDLARDINRAREAGVRDGELAEAQRTLRTLARVLGLTLSSEESDLAAKPFIDLLVSIRQELRAARQWELADRIRDQLLNQGITLEDRAGGTTWRKAG